MLQIEEVLEPAAGLDPGAAYQAVLRLLTHPPRTERPLADRSAHVADGKNGVGNGHSALDLRSRSG